MSKTINRTAQRQLAGLLDRAARALAGDIDPDSAAALVEALQQKLLMGRTTLYRKLLALTGEVPSQFLRSFRLARAAQLLLKGHGNVTEVSLAVGFTNPAYFSECFKQKFGITPSRYTASDRMSDS